MPPVSVTDKAMKFLNGNTNRPTRMGDFRQVDDRMTTMYNRLNPSDLDKYKDMVAKMNTPQPAEEPWTDEEWRLWEQFNPPRPAAPKYYPPQPPAEEPPM